MNDKAKILDKIGGKLYLPSGDKLFAPKTFAREKALKAMQEYADSKSKLEVKEKPDTDSNFWKNLKWKVGAIQWDKLSMSGTAIEANPATHAICEMIVNYYINPRDAAIAERDAKIAELEKLIPKNGYYIGQHEVIYEQKQISKLESELKEAKDMIATAFGYDIPIKLKRLYEKYFQDKR